MILSGNCVNSILEQYGAKPVRRIGRLGYMASDETGTATSG
jgi:hypothetical protein